MILLLFLWFCLSAIVSLGFGAFFTHMRLEEELVELERWERLTPEPGRVRFLPYDWATEQ